MMKQNNMLMMAFLVVFPISATATVQDEVDALELRVDITELDITDLDERVIKLEDPEIVEFDIVYLRKDCGSIKTSECFTSLITLNDWMQIRQPSEGSPLLVDIGPGNYIEEGASFLCEDMGHITYRGAGRDNTIMPTLFGKNCDNLSVQNLKILATGDGSNDVAGIDWRGTGSSSYSDVDVEVNGSGANSAYGWLDTRDRRSPCVSGANRPVHYWFGSTITVAGAGLYNKGYISQCETENWFYGGEITVVADQPGISSSYAVELNGKSSMQIFGSLVRSLVGPVVSSANFRPIGVFIVEESSFHMHGGILSALAQGTTATDVGALGIRTADNSKAHIVDTAFNVKAVGNGIAARIIDESSNPVLSPFQWPQGTTPPNIESITGADTFVETDCSPTGCQIVGSEPHLMIYNEACTAVSNDPWFDAITKRCRSELPTPPTPSSGVQPPMTGNIGDSFIELDCTADGDCESGMGTGAHLMIYNDSCVINNLPWFHVARGKCRGEP